MSDTFQAFRIADFAVTQPAPDTRRPAPAAADPSGVVIERADAGRLAAIEHAWRDLAGRALEPNVFMDPGMLQAAMAAVPDRRFVALLAWDSAGPDARLVGIWGAVMSRALLPVRVLQTPASPHGFLATPVLDGQWAEPVLHAMLDAVAAAPDLPNIVSAAPMGADGSTMAALRRVMQERQAPVRVFTQWRRPMLRSGRDADSYLADAMSSSTRKKLRQHRRRLAERGALTSPIFKSVPDVCAALEQFFALEAAGWKGRRGDALICSSADAAFTRNMIATLSARGDAQIHALCLDGRPISMQIVLRCGGTAFTWKTAYDENLHDFSPGILLFEDYTKAFLADASVASVDSCTFDESSYMSSWCERETLANLWIDACRGGAPGFAILAQAQDALLWMRGQAKQFYKSGLRTWKKFKH